MELEQSLLHSIPDQLKRRKSSIFFQVLRAVWHSLKIKKYRQELRKKKWQKITFINFILWNKLFFKK
jgi:hypothetical protein